MPTEPAQRPVAALFVGRRSIYRHLPGVDPWDRTRDARQFAGGMPVVAHPPCRCWSKLRHQVTLDAKAAAAEKALGIWAVEMVMRWGGVLEQPAGSLLWQACQLPGPGDRRDPFLWTLYLEQSWFGFPTPKPTWLLVCGVPPHLVKVPSYHLMTRSRIPFNRLNEFDRSRTMRPLAEWLCQVARASWWPERERSFRLNTRPHSASIPLSATVIAGDLQAPADNRRQTEVSHKTSSGQSWNRRLITGVAVTAAPRAGLLVEKGHGND